MATAVATGFYLSYIPVKFSKVLPALYADRKWSGAGFVGTLEGWIGIYFMPQDSLKFMAVLLGAIAIACWLSGIAERELGHRDDSRIVIDEVVGYWVTVAFLPRRAALLAAGFVLFRVLDSIKLPPYRWLERLPGGYGVVMDDVGAGIFANIILRILWSGMPA